MKGGDRAAIEPTVSAETAPSGSVVIPLTPERRVGRYTLGACIGAGGMGVVYQAFDPDLNRNVAIKLVHPQQSGAPGAQDRILQEARTLAKISHPNVVPIHDCGIADQTVYIVMELIAGSTLVDWLSARRRPRREVLQVFEFAGEGLAAAHGVGLVHRDFKPGNVLLGPQGRVFVVDFGLAMASPLSGQGVPAERDAATHSSAVCGTPGYMAPEQWRGEKIDQRADQYSFCVALHEALVGQKPKDGSLGGLPDGEAVPHARSLTPKVQRILARGLSAERAQRFDSMNELLSELRLALAPSGGTRRHGAPVLRMQDRQRALRHRLFVGRKPELKLLFQALRGRQGHLWFVHGPGGVGKTTLIQELTYQSPRGAASVVRLDLRDIVPSPDSFRAGLAEAMGLPDETVYDAAAWPSQCQVLVLDNLETIGPLERWLRDTFLPKIPAHVDVICISRNGPSADWKSDLAWRELLREVPLAVLSPDESREVLTRRKVPSVAQTGILTFAQGHPLALSLAADLVDQHAGPLDLGSAPDLIAALLRRFVDQVPTPLHRTALDLCAIVRTTSEALLARFIKPPHTHEVWTWLRELSFMQAGANGLIPHDLVRTALLADLKWRNIEHLRVMKSEIMKSGLDQIRDGTLTEKQAAADFWYLERDHPIYSTFVPLVEDGPVVEVATARDLPDIVAMARKHEGEASAAIVTHWLERQPESTLVMRASTKDSTAIGFLTNLALERTTAAERAADPATELAWRHLEEVGAAATDRGIVFKRFWMARDTYQDISPVQSLSTSHTLWHTTFTPNVAYFLVVYSDPGAYAPMLAFLESKTIGQFDVGDRRYTLLGRDWRSESPFQRLAKRYPVPPPE